MAFEEGHKFRDLAWARGAVAEAKGAAREAVRDGAERGPHSPEVDGVGAVLQRRRLCSREGVVEAVLGIGRHVRDNKVRARLVRNIRPHRNAIHGNLV